jgi:hypothetical protein
MTTPKTMLMKISKTKKTSRLRGSFHFGGNPDGRIEGWRAAARRR